MLSLIPLRQPRSIRAAGAAITLLSDQPIPLTDGEDAVSGAEPFRRTLHVRHFVSRQATNNVAEYLGLVSALRVAKRQVLDLLFDGSSQKSPFSLLEMKLVIQGDSKLVIEQLQGSWQCKHPNLQPLYAEALNLIEEIRRMSPGNCRVFYEHILREYNSVADGT
jgi:ribonuclease HI